MSEATEPTPTASLPGAPAPATRLRSGCLGRFVSALLIVIITTFLSLVAVVLAYVYVLETPSQFVDIRGQLSTAEAQNADLRAQNSAMQTQVADLAKRADTDREALGELQQQKLGLDQLRAEFADGARQNATLVADSHASRDSVALFATAESGRAALLDDLKRRSDRLERFLQRLSDISGDAALDLGADTATQPPALPAPSRTDTPTPALPTDTPTPIASVTPTDTPAPVPTATPTRRPAATQRSTATPRLSPTSSTSDTPTP
jgi:cell division protein FtsB